MGTLQAATCDFSTRRQLQGTPITNAMTLPKGFEHRAVAGLSVDQEDGVFPHLLRREPGDGLGRLPDVDRQLSAIASAFVKAFHAARPGVSDGVHLQR